MNNDYDQAWGFPPLMVGFCPCSEKCCDNTDTFCPPHTCYEDVCESCFVSRCKNCGAECCCDL